MSAYEVTILTYVLAGLLVWCIGYAWLITWKPVRRWYLRHNKTWFMVVLGVLWVFVALAVLSLYGIFDFWYLGLVMVCFCVAGAPMIFFQYLQQAKDGATYDAAKKRREKNGANDGAEN